MKCFWVLSSSNGGRTIPDFVVTTDAVFSLVCSFLSDIRFQNRVINER